MNGGAGWVGSSREDTTATGDEIMYMFYVSYVCDDLIGDVPVREYSPRLDN